MTFWVSNFVGAATAKAKHGCSGAARERSFAAVKRVAEWCKKNRHRRVKDQFKLLNAKLRGYYNYYGVNGNYASLKEFFDLSLSAEASLYEEPGVGKPHAGIRAGAVG